MRKPSITQLVRAVRLVGAVVGVRAASYCFEGRIAVALPAGWTLLISPDDAGRFRVEACHSDCIRATMWCLATDETRLAELASSMAREAAALTV